jgi:hypothetical protein
VFIAALGDTKDAFQAKQCRQPWKATTLNTLAQFRRNSPGFCFGGVGQHHQKLLTTIAPEPIDIAYTPAQMLGDMPQNFVTGRMSMLAVHLLEVQQINENH